MLNKNLPITLAAGHVGNVGARGCGYKEEELTKELVVMLTRKFKALGYNAIDVTPQGSYTINGQLVAEYTNANKIANTQLHICVHFNASNGQGHGTETWIYSMGSKANSYATTINNAICNTLGTTNRGIKASGNSLCIPRRVNAPTCLLEVVFIDNQSDMNKYVANKEKVADAIIKALTGEVVSNVTSTPQVSQPTATQPQVEKSLVQKAKEFVGSRCKELQEKLIKLGYNCGGYGADGQFGQGTLDSLLAFQKDNGLVVDGLAGSATFSKLDQLIAKKNSNSNSRENVRKIQRLCNSVLKSGLVVDGIWGELTEKAVKKLPLCGLPYVQRECTRFVQEVLGISIDGIFGNGTASSVKSFQKSVCLSQDAIVGFNTYKALAFK